MPPSAGRPAIIIFSCVLSVGCTSVVAQERFGDFRIERRTDPLTDEDETVLFTQELEPATFRAGFLVWRCFGPDLLRAVVFVGSFLGGDEVNVRWRFDSLPASGGTEWAVSYAGTTGHPLRLRKGHPIRCHSKTGRSRRRGCNTPSRRTPVCRCPHYRGRHRARRPGCRPRRPSPLRQKAH